MADHMAGPTAEAAASWIQWAVSLIGAAFVPIFLLIVGWLKGSITSTEIKLDQWIQGQSEVRVKAAETYATKDDLRDLAREIKDDREKNRRDMIAMLTGMERRITAQIKLQIAASHEGGEGRH